MATDRAVSLINRLDSGKFGKLLERLIIRMPLSSKIRPTDVFSFDEREKLVSVFELTSAADLTSILDFSAKIFEQFGFEQTTTTTTKSDQLLEKLTSKNYRLDQEHVETITKIWLKEGKSLIDRLKSKSTSDNQLSEVNFVLNVDVGSESRTQLNQPTVYLQLITEKIGGEKEKTNLEFDHGQLLNLYDKLEEVQKQLDALTG